MPTAKVKKITPVLFAEDLGPSIQFWTGSLDFTGVVEVPEGDKLGFVLLEKDGGELMYQSYAIADKDNAATGQAARRGPTFLYVEVDDLHTALAATAGAETVMPVRSTFYGAREFGIKEPAGHYVIFAQQGAAEQS